MARTPLEDSIKEKAKILGFAIVGFARDVPESAADFYDWWTEQGFGAEMSYLTRHREKKRSISHVLPGARTAILCALPFPGGEPVIPEEPSGKIARYAFGRDYHEVLAEKLTELARFVDENADVRPTEPSRAFVDSAPINERSLAEAAGIGWIGKNAMLINPEFGSWFWLGEVLTQVELAADAAPLADRCGSCRRCLDACPTQAILEDKRAIDSARCISYLTIEKKGAIPDEFHTAIGDWLVGCDICQEVCPWNKHSLKHGRRNLGEPQVEWLAVNKIATMSPEEFKARFGERAISRTKLAGLQRNAEIVRGNLDGMD